MPQTSKPHTARTLFFAVAKITCPSARAPLGMAMHLSDAQSHSEWPPLVSTLLAVCGTTISRSALLSRLCLGKL